VEQNKVGELRLFKLFGHFSLLLAVCFSALNSQESFKNFKKSQAESFKTYKDERDNAFNDYLKQEWKAYNVFISAPLFEKEKPLEIDSAKPQKIKPVGPRVTIKIKKIVDKKETEAVKVESEVKNSSTPVLKDYDISFDFYGSELGFDIPKGIKTANFYPENKTGITNFFSSAASSEYDTLLSNIKKISTKMNLNDWGIYLLVSRVADLAFMNEDNSRLLSWFIFNKLGYAVKIGLAKKHVVLMHYSKKLIYSTPNYTFNKKRYYVLANYAKGSVGRLFSYKQDYPGSTKELDLSLKTLPKLALKEDSKTLEFKEFGNRYTIPIVYNKNLIEFMNTYPQADYETFFNAPVENRTYADIASSIKKYIDGKKASEAINFVLRFVQKSFKYEQDNQQFGREKVMFAQETLYYDKSDCEDRAVLFAYLVKKLFRVSVLGVKYRDHMATALYIPIDGDKVMAGSKKFVIADPTYINANIGVSMPKYRAIRPQSYIRVKKMLK